MPFTTLLRSLQFLKSTSFDFSDVETLASLNEILVRFDIKIKSEENLKTKRNC